MESLMESRSDFMAGASGNPATVSDPPTTPTTSYWFYDHATWGRVCRFDLVPGAALNMSFKRTFPLVPGAVYDLVVDYQVYSGVAQLDLNLFSLDATTWSWLNLAQTQLKTLVPNGFQSARARFAYNGLPNALWPTPVPFPAESVVGRAGIGVSSLAGGSGALIVIKRIAVVDVAATENLAQALGGIALARPVEITSSVDGYKQPCFYYKGKPSNPLLISCHSWDGQYSNYDFFTATLAWCVEKEWNFISPDFRGAANSAQYLPLHAGSDAAIQDILDARTWALADCHATRCYIVGGSGGGYMAILSAARHPTLFAGVGSAAGIADLASWHAYCAQNSLVYASELEAIMGGTPAQKPADYASRSPVSYLAALNMPIAIQHGFSDTTVPSVHALDFFDGAAAAHGAAGLTTQERSDLIQGLPLPAYLAAESGTQNGYKYAIPFQRETSDVRISLLDCEHTGDPRMFLDYLFSKDAV